jgi:hypothetical protein
MFPRSLSDHLETLINELIAEGGLDSASLASILIAAQDSVNRGYSLELTRRVWLASNDLQDQDHKPEPEPEPKPEQVHEHEPAPLDPNAQGSPWPGQTRSLSRSIL